MTSDGTILWRALLQQATEALQDAHEARWLCEEVFGERGPPFQLALSTAVTERVVSRFDALLARRIAGEPLQYVLGSWSFRTLELMVDQRVLIPRPETEVVTGVALDRARSFAAPVRVIDLGTGSGAIALSLAAEMPVGSIEVWATDVSADALDVARANLAGVGRKGSVVRFACGSWFDALPNDMAGCVHVVVANPPYISPDDSELETSVRQWEPAIALFADNDGLAAYQHIVGEAWHWLIDDGWLVLEIGYKQASAVGDLCRASGLRDVLVTKDLAGRDRVIQARRPNR